MSALIGLALLYVVFAGDKKTAAGDQARIIGAGAGSTSADVAHTLITGAAGGGASGGRVKVGPESTDVNMSVDPNLDPNADVYF